MKILVFGANGMLGHKIVQVFRDRFDVWATIRNVFSEIERYEFFERDRIIGNVIVTDPESVRRAIKSARPDVVINAVGIIKQLPSSKDVIRTLSVNSIFPHQLAEMSEEFGFRLICISTDCVFDGQKGNYTEDDPADALDLYGRSKHFGEVSNGNCLTLRTSIIGRELSTAHSLVEWFLSNEGNSVKGFVNAIYSGFPTIVFADIIADLIVNHKDLNGLYQVSSASINKFELLRLIKSEYDLNIEIERFEEFKIDRSLDSAKFRAATGFLPQPWEKMIAQMAADPTPYSRWRK